MHKLTCATFGKTLQSLATYLFHQNTLKSAQPGEGTYCCVWSIWSFSAKYTCGRLESIEKIPYLSAAIVCGSSVHFGLHLHFIFTTMRAAEC